MIICVSRLYPAYFDNWLLVYLLINAYVTKIIKKSVFCFDLRFQFPFFLLILTNIKIVTQEFGL